jgi:hypothetical protein
MPCLRGHDRFAVHLKKQLFNCRGCGAHGGDAIALVQFLDGQSFKEAVEKISGVKNSDENAKITLSTVSARSSIAKDIERCKRIPLFPDNAALAAWLWGGREPVSETTPPGSICGNAAMGANSR